ncbi:hypothetical protein ABPG72_000240 [Tetrahymena utriculariae]
MNNTEVFQQNEMDMYIENEVLSSATKNVDQKQKNNLYINETDDEEEIDLHDSLKTRKKLKKETKDQIFEKCNQQQKTILQNVEFQVLKYSLESEQALESDSFDETVQKVDNKEQVEQYEEIADETDVGELPEFLQKENIKDKKGNKIGSENYDPTTLLIEESQLKKFKPYMKEYWRIKSDHYDKIVLIKLGRFYEAYYEDSFVCNQILQPKYSRKNKCGFPEEILFPYLSKLTECNLKVVIVDQLETEKQQKERIKLMKSQNIKLTEKDKLMKRDVVAIYTKGTAALQLVRGRKLQLSTSTYILSIVTEKYSFSKKITFGLTLFDSITGKILLACFEDDNIYSTFQKIIYVYRPSEIIYRKQTTDIESLRLLSQLPTKPLTIQLNEETIWKPTYAFNHIVDIFGSDDIENKWPKCLYFYSRSEDNPSYQLTYSALSALMYYMKSNLLFDETIPIANFIRIDNENNREISDYELKDPNYDYKVEEEDSNNNQNMEKEEDQTQKETNQEDKRLIMDSQTLSNLDILEVSYGNKESNYLLKQYSLLQLLDRTSTKSGERLMKLWVASPLIDKQQIEQRLDAIEDLQNHNLLRDQFREKLQNLCDLENILSRLYSYRVKNKSRGVYFEDVSQQRLRELKNFFEDIKQILTTIKDTFFMESNTFKSTRLKMLVGGNKKDKNYNPNDILHDICLKKVLSIEKKILWIGLKKHIPTPVPGICEAYDNKLKDIEDHENEFSNYIKNIRKQFGDDRIQFCHSKAPYQLEIPIELVKGDKKPAEFELTSITKKTQRFHTPQLKQLINKQLLLQDQLKQYLGDFTCVVFDEFFKFRNNWNQIVSVVAEIDCLISLSQVSFHETMIQKLGFMTRPVIVDQKKDESNYLKIIQGKHPCVALKKQFQANSIIINTQHNKINYPKVQIITGPNMGGKSTILRSASLIVIMAQIGCYVPCQYLEFSPFDRIFTRIGMRDLLSQGKSTFYIELEETLQIVKNSNQKSLVLIDELGRGTSTYDGVALASGVLEHIIQRNKSCCLFSTHSNFLVEQYQDSPMVKLFKMGYELVPNEKNQIKFTYKLCEGKVEQSFSRNVLDIVGFEKSLIFESHFRSCLINLSLMNAQNH